MKINTKELREDITKLHLEGSSEALDLQSKEADFYSPVVCDLICAKSGSKFVCEGKLLTKVSLECARCLANFSYELKTKLDFILDEMNNQIELIAEGGDFSIRVGYGEDLNIDHLVREALLLALPLKPLCTSDCKGLCPVCGTDLNTSTCKCQKGKADPRWEKLRDFFKE